MARTISDDEALSHAREVLAWRASGTPRQPFAGIAGGDLDDCYAVQDALHRLLTEDGADTIAGYKIALTSRAMQQMVNVATPLGGAVFSSAVHRCGAAIRPLDFLRLGLECEVAVRLGEGLPAAGAPYTREGVAKSVDACAPAFELVEDGQVDYTRIDAPTLVVDNCWNGGIVVGEWVERAPGSWLDRRFTDSATVLELDGEQVDRGCVGDAMGHPFEAVAWVANLLARRGKGIEAGMLVMTGSSVRTVFPDAGTVARFRVDGLGEVTLTLTA